MGVLDNIRNAAEIGRLIGDPIGRAFEKKGDREFEKKQAEEKLAQEMKMFELKAALEKELLEKRLGQSDYDNDLGKEIVRNPDGTLSYRDIMPAQGSGNPLQGTLSIKSQQDTEQALRDFENKDKLQKAVKSFESGESDKRRSFIGTENQKDRDIQSEKLKQEKSLAELKVQQDKKANGKIPTAEVTFETNIDAFKRHADQLEKTVTEYGGHEGGLPIISDPEATAALASIPYAMAIEYAKLKDPESVAREGEVASAKKYLIPIGATTRNSVTLAAIRQQRKDIEELKKSRDRAKGVSTESSTSQSQAIPEGMKLQRNKVTGEIRLVPK